MNHLENYQYEVYVPQQERNWLEWATSVENQLGHSLDGDAHQNGYSLDDAYDAFKRNVYASSYVYAVRQNPNYK